MSATRCTKCETGRYIKNNKGSKCRLCSAADPHCLQCASNESFIPICSRCASGYSYKTLFGVSKCWKICSGNGEYVDSDNQCKACSVLTGLHQCTDCSYDSSLSFWKCSTCKGDLQPIILSKDSPTTQNCWCPKGKYRKSMDSPTTCLSCSF